MKKGNAKYDREIIDDKNLTVSVEVSLTESLKKQNINLITNKKRNMMRMYQNYTKIQSGNYDNLKYYRDGIQMSALNLQYISNPWFINKAIFLPQTGKPCSPDESIYDVSCINSWKYSIDKSFPNPYRLKPLWLLGLIPYPDLYDLTLKLTKVEKINNDISENIGNEYEVTIAYKKRNVDGGSAWRRSTVRIQLIGIFLIEVKDHGILLLCIKIFRLIQQSFRHTPIELLPFYQLAG